jgi:hypothetical protein
LVEKSAGADILMPRSRAINTLAALGFFLGRFEILDDPVYLFQVSIRHFLDFFGQFLSRNHDWLLHFKTEYRASFDPAQTATPWLRCLFFRNPQSAIPFAPSPVFRRPSSVVGRNPQFSL